MQNRECKNKILLKNKKTESVAERVGLSLRPFCLVLAFQRHARKCRSIKAIHSFLCFQPSPLIQPFRAICALDRHQRHQGARAKTLGHDCFHRQLDPVAARFLEKYRPDPAQEHHSGCIRRIGSTWPFRRRTSRKRRFWLSNHSREGRGGTDALSRIRHCEGQPFGSY